jgi:HPt (histidine-containing phosphotransfer) domain-containing protein
MDAAPFLDVLWLGVVPTPLPFPSREAVEDAASPAVELEVRRFDLVIRPTNPDGASWQGGSDPVVSTLAGLDAALRLLGELCASWFRQGDPDVAPLRASYHERLAGRMKRLEAAQLVGDPASLAHLAHQIAGTARLYGYVALEWETDALRKAARSGDLQQCAWQLARVQRAAARPRIAG